MGEALGAGLSPAFGSNKRSIRPESFDSERNTERERSSD